MPVDLIAENEITLPDGSTLRLPDEAIVRELKVTVTCGYAPCGKTISWSQIDVARNASALPAEAKSIQKLTGFDGTEHVFCGIDCLVKQVQLATANAKAGAHPSGIHRVK